jgi:hypothetical protein
MSDKLPVLRFTIKDNYGRISTADYKWNKNDGIPDQETILENMEKCTCSLNESVNHCECEPEFDNGEIVSVELLQPTQTYSEDKLVKPVVDREKIIDIVRAYLEKERCDGIECKECANRDMWLSDFQAWIRYSDNADSILREVNGGD